MKLLIMNCGIVVHFQIRATQQKRPPRLTANSYAAKVNNLRKVLREPKSGSDISLNEESLLNYCRAALRQDERPQTRLFLLTQGATLAYGRAAAADL